MQTTLTLLLLAVLAVQAQSPLPPRAVRQPTSDVVTLQVTTNVTTQWMPLRQVSTNGVRSVGFLTTNRLALVIHAGRTNVVLLDQLGQEDYPSQQATNLVTGDPRARRLGGPAR